MADFLNKKIQAGDMVIYHSKKYHCLMKASITSIAPKTVLLNDGLTTLRQPKDQIVKISGAGDV